METLQIFFKDHNGYDGYSWIARQSDCMDLYDSHPKDAVAFLPSATDLKEPWIDSLVNAMREHGIRFVTARE